MFAKTLKDIAGNRSLPLPSELLMAFSGFVQSIGWWLIPAAMIGTPVFLFYFYKTTAGKALLDRFVLALPVFGSLCRKLDTARFARTLSVLLNAGVDVGNSIDMTANVLTMTPIRQAVRSARPKIISGRELSGILDDTAAVQSRCDFRDRLGRRDRQAAGEPCSSCGRLRRASHDRWSRIWANWSNRS